VPATIEVFGSDSAASNVVYALCAQALQPDVPFAEAMNRVFRAPMIVEPDAALDSIYHRAYEVYQRHVSCALDV
jgi:hypothetical protein